MPRNRTIDWANILDFDLAVKNVRTDIFGDWHRDPWDWPENEWLITPEGMSHLIQALNEDGVRRTMLLDVPKENFATRPAIVFDPVDRLIYQALVDRVSTKLIGSMPRWSFSWRLSRKKPTPGKYVSMGSEWRGYRSRLQQFSELCETALVTDIVSFFPSIPIDGIIDAIYDAAGASEVVDRIAVMLNGWSAVSGRSGLPMRANASCVLSAMYLRPVDDVLLMHGKAVSSRFSGSFLQNFYPLGEGTACRWVDDVWLFGDERSDLRAAQMDLQDTMRSLGLNINLAKTDVLEGDDMISKARQLEHSAVDVALDNDQPDFEPLDALIDRLLEKPETANHTSVRFATVRMRRHDKFERVHEFVDVAERMPHSAAALSRLFHDSERYVDLGGWFNEYLDSNWARMEVAVAQFVTMFPSASTPGKDVIDTLVKKVLSGCSLSLMAVVIQRLVAWDKAQARPLIRELSKRADNPHARRVLALAALNAQESRSWVDNLLSEFRENVVIRDFLRARNFTPVPAGADFVGY